MARQHDPKTAPAIIIRYLRSNPEENKTAKKVNGEQEAVRWLKKLNKEEKEPEKYGYLWRWKNPQAALAYQLEMLDRNADSKE